MPAVATTPARQDAMPAVAASKEVTARKPEHTMAEPATINQVSGGSKPIGEDMPGHPDWCAVLAQLNVQGMAQQLAKNCTLENFSDQQITLCLSQEHKHLQTNKTAIGKLQAALSDYFAKPVKLNIMLGKAEAATPAAVEQQAKELKRQQACDSIAQDIFVREAQAELGANLIVESIKPIQ